ncbi:AraC family transcriptional regulator [Methanobacterium aggregans]|uniref:AraC family transcriptional regulator n=1 Tax=Methanobacterium aggregans TaxID=1615586 RepID=UPI001AE11B32|nr:GyrI-like domain-containing protein [Methanobacterium aggregans]MBP2045719.1 effector-binding domain-containing protein [Methanobacterium aggregans]
MEVTEKRIEELKVAYIPYSGSYDKIPEHMQEVGQLVMKKNLKMTGTVYGTYFNSPEDVPEDKLEYEIGFSVEDEIPQEDELGFKDIPEHTVLAATHKGPYTDVGPVIHTVAQHAVDNGYDIVGPITEVYLNDPNMVSEEELLTEVRLPVIKVR